MTICTRRMRSSTSRISTGGLSRFACSLRSWAAFKSDSISKVSMRFSLHTLQRKAGASKYETSPLRKALRTRDRKTNHRLRFRRGKDYALGGSPGTESSEIASHSSGKLGFEVSRKESLGFASLLPLR